MMFRLSKHFEIERPRSVNFTDLDNRLRQILDPVGFQKDKLKED